MKAEETDRHKKLSRFMCQELLYEFVSTRLDPERQQAVDDYLTTCRDSQRELEQLKRGMHFTESAAKLELSESMREALLNFEPQWKKVFAAWTMWSSQRGWKVLPYLFIVGALSLGLMVTKPWHDFSHRQEVLLDQAKPEPDALTPPTDAQMEAPAGKPMVEAAPSEPVPPPAALPTLVPKVTAAAASASQDAQAEENTDDDASAIELKGSLTTAKLTAEEFASAYPAIREKVLALGGKAAGNTELGALRESGDAYFHFSLPESKRAEFEEYLKTFGPVQISSERHPRVMPEGQIRIILTVKDGKVDEGHEKAESP